MLSLVFAMSLAAATPVPPEPGVSETLARERASAIKDLRYQVAFVIPAERSAPVRGSVTVRFTLAAPHRVVLDFPQPRGSVQAVHTANGPVDAAFENGHIVVAAAQTRAGLNELTIEFTAGDESLNRNDEFLYTLFVPARARLAFPVLRSAGPQGALHAHARRAGRLAGRCQRRGDRSRTPVTGAANAACDVRRDPAAADVPVRVRGGQVHGGDGRRATAARSGCCTARPTPRRSRATATRSSTCMPRRSSGSSGTPAIPYPFGKFDFVAHPVVPVQRDGARRRHPLQRLRACCSTSPPRRTSCSIAPASIAHETAHMWFGDLVTMRWFNDVWMKEVFANFMAAKIVNPSFPQLNHELRFLLTHYPAAYQVDRTAGTNRDPAAAREPRRGGTALRADHLPEGADRDAAARDAARRDGAARRAARVSEALRVRQRDVARPGASCSTRARRANLAAWSRAWVEERGRPEFDVETQWTREAASQSITLHDDAIRWVAAWCGRSGCRSPSATRQRSSAGRGRQPRDRPCVTGARGPGAAACSCCRTAAGLATGCSCWTTRAATTCSLTSRRCPIRSRGAAPG